MGDVKGIDEARVVPWLEANIDGFAGPAEFTLIAGGHSNLTFGVTDANGTKYVLRRPPLGHVLQSAHDMGREHKIIKALNGTNVPVPPALGFCEDIEVNGAPFYVMGFVDGHIIRTSDVAKEKLTEEQRRTAGESLVDVMADMHAVDVDAVGLGDLGKKTDYMQRQLKRWNTQFKGSSELTKRTVPSVEEVHDFLAARIPEQGPAAIVHGDYRLDNCMIGFDGNVAAVLDWELCTLGDAMADVGLLMVYWNDPDDAGSALLAPSTTAPGFLKRAELLERYAARSGRDVSQVDYYTAFGYWKLACIIEGVYARYAAGVMGSQDEKQIEGFRNQVDFLADRAKA
ncbi:MAG TPA: phosphotransferase family protein, partial [Acidimicrobiales bacterium]|nr:phosphotransferase family protein [Acidimicrobiales bacterium]